jgi:two-component system, NarL family, nitrate/nitrite response regulator NarL
MNIILTTIGFTGRLLRSKALRTALTLGLLLAESEKRNKKSQPIRILIADDHPIFRDGLRRLLETEPQFVVIGEASDGDEAVKAAKELKTDILLLDLNMPRVHGLEALKDLTTSGTPVRIILLTAEIQKPQIVEALLLGASGLIMKDTPTQLLFKAIRTVMSGEYWIGRESVSDIIQTLRDLAYFIRTERRKDNFGLTPRELEIVRALSAGDTNKDIARRFSISEQTVKHHLTNIFNKTGVSQRLELALFALSHNLMDVENTNTKERPLSWQSAGKRRNELDLAELESSGLLSKLLPKTH